MAGGVIAISIVDEFHLWKTGKSFSPKVYLASIGGGAFLGLLIGALLCLKKDDNPQN